MTKTEFVAAVTGTHGIRKKNAPEAVDTVVTALAQAVIDGEFLNLPGFGTFSLKEQAARPGHNPASGERIRISAQRGIHFKAAGGLQRKVPQPQ
ncbi:MAG: HU family DNA-binding protein [Gammaproteobacteria bacterium]|nr:HU family DNA-binding protein [Gammaproteobacteria bacterium]